MKTMPQNKILKPIRSFVRRQRQLTPLQQRAWADLWPRYGIETKGQSLTWTQVFTRQAPIIFDIGFGQGTSMIELAHHYPDHNIFGIDIHGPGISQCLNAAADAQLEHLRIMRADVSEILTNLIPDNSLQRIYILFPDPWPKQRHHKRRLIQATFVATLIKKLSHGGILHIATDWQDYADHILKVLQALPELHPRDYNSSWRPATKYEQRGLRLGHTIHDFVYGKA